MDEPRTLKRSQFAVIVVLSSLNDTFERKYLVVPFAPYVMKLGRQTTSKSAASSENGFFDSRVLSRQHAEIWADRETGKVYIKDCKSSNGTYINRKRLSAENTESEPHELKRNDNLDLGIDIVSNEENKQVYKKISARVEKVSMLPLNVGLQQRMDLSADSGPGSDSTASPKSNSNASNSSLSSISSSSSNSSSSSSSNSNSNSNSSSSFPNALEKPSVKRSPSIATLRPSNKDNDAIFGATLESLALNHVNTAGGELIRDSVRSHLDFETTAKRLVQEIRSIRADTAKIKSVVTLLEDIKRAGVESENRDKIERQNLEDARQRLDQEKQERRHILKSSSLAALKAENTRIKTELAYLSSRAEKRERKSSRGSHSRSHSHQPLLNLSYSNNQHIVNNLLVLLGTTLLVTLSGMWIMYFFNPPVMPRNFSQ